MSNEKTVNRDSKAAPAAPGKAYFMVRSVSTFRKDGSFRRAEMQFTHEWRGVVVDNRAHQEAIAAVREKLGDSAKGLVEAEKAAALALLEEGVITTGILERLKREQLLAVKPSSPEEISDFEEGQRRISTASPDEIRQQLAEALRRIGELEARGVGRALAAKGEARE